MDLGGVSRRQVWTFQGERRQKTRKFIAYGLIGSSPLRLGKVPVNTDKDFIEKSSQKTDKIKEYNVPTKTFGKDK